MRSSVLFFLGLVIAISASARNAQQGPGDKKASEKAVEGMPAVEQIIDKYVQALGGKSAIEKITSQVSKGSFEIPNFGATGSVEIFAKAPNKQLSVSNSPGFGSVLRGYDGSVGWEDSPMSGLRDLKGGELALMKRDSDLYRSLKFKEFYSKLTVTGKEKVNDREAYLIDAVPNEGNPEKLYFDAQTGLLIRKDVEMTGRQGKVMLNIFLDDYREVNGVKIPFTERRVSPSFSLTIKLDEVKHNLPIDDAKFSKPAPRQ